MQYNVTLRKKDNGWQCIVSYKDGSKWKQKSKQGFKGKYGKADAKEAADKIVKDLKKDIALCVPEDFKGITFESFSKQYLEHSKLYNEPKTIQSTETVLKRFSKLNDTELSKITTLEIQKIVDDLVKEGLKTNTIKYYLKKLTIIFNSAKNQYNIISSVPTHKIIIGKMNEINKRALTENEVKDLLEKLKNRYKNKYKNKYYKLTFIAVNTGMRMGEILGLKWSDIDFEHHLISVNRQWKLLADGTYGFGTLKTKNSKRTIPVSKSFCNELAEYKKIINIDARIFNFKAGTCVSGYSANLFKECGYDISFHELRHTYATKLIANGMDFKTAAQILGHNIQQTIKTYSHVNNDMINRAKNLIENIF